MGATMIAIKLDILLILLISHVSYCQRRIQEGLNLTSPKSYVVYLVKATLSTRNYDYWLCGGAIVSSEFVITSAACVEDVKYLYVIAGYNKNVIEEDLDKDECTKNMKKKVVFTCVPVSYEFDFDILEKWSYIDIALVKVESPYDFTDSNYEKYCSYLPSIITINYDPKYQIADTDAMVLGWGHDQLWRKHGDMNNYNSENLQYASTLIMDKEECMKEYEVYPNMTFIIEQYMICSLKEGNIDDQGQQIVQALPTATGCAQGTRQGISCEEVMQYPDNAYPEPYPTRRKSSDTNRTIYNYTTYDFIKKVAKEKNTGRTRRNGICQNDHGGPLVTWVGRKEVLIGIASVFKITEDNKCIGPFLYTSTMCNGAFLECVLNNPQINKKQAGRMELCDSPPNVKGFDMVQKHISWKDHPAGPAENEINHNIARDRLNKNKAPENGYAPNQNMGASQQYAQNANMGASQQNAQGANMEARASQQNGETQSHDQGYPENYSPPLDRYQGSKKILGMKPINRGGFSMRPQHSLYKSV